MERNDARGHGDAMEGEKRRMELYRVWEQDEVEIEVDRGGKGEEVWLSLGGGGGGGGFKI